MSVIDFENSHVNHHKQLCSSKWLVCLGFYIAKMEEQSAVMTSHHIITINLK
jgi:hypothetical protein